jgi:aminobenzoyl-glutamate transport protein
VSTMVPFSIVFLLGWSIMFVLWITLGVPVGPGAPLSLPVTP